MFFRGMKYYLVSAVCIFIHIAILAQARNVETGESLAENLSPGDTATIHPDTSSKTNLFLVGAIVISGEKKTKHFVIEREIPFKVGDSVSLNKLVEQFEVARRQLMNTRLFNEVVVSLKRFVGHNVEVQVDVKERWYIFPVPYFKPIDRNLSEWAKQGYGLDRVNYGAKLSWYNFSGRNDKLKAWFITGYTQQIQFSYEQPYANKSLKHGYAVNLSYGTAKQINHITLDNEQKFFPQAKQLNLTDTLHDQLFNGQVLNEIFTTSVSYTYRPALRTRHSLRLSYNINKIDESVATLNPKYFNDGRQRIAYPELSYLVNYNNIDYVAYPLKGFIGEAGISRAGINRDMNLWQLTARGTRGWQVANKTFYGLQAYGVLKLPFDQPYYNQRVFGYGDFYLRGLEKYVIDGVAAFMVRNTMRREVLKFNIPFSLSKSHSMIPFRIFVKTYGDMGYSYNKSFTQNSLVNRMLYTGGAGVDVVTYYDIVLRFEYSCNQLGQKGLFLHFKNDF
ncbi:MAG TPA: POTRA domain-containing protein [Chitinophagaceae bacterium]|nr:POTRA domain-containing protein [Chitinophagaceae bacterium]